jgi:hypothetical protein
LRGGFAHTRKAQHQTHHIYNEMHSKTFPAAVI